MRRILVVDDDHELARLLAFALQRRGYVVELATNGVTRWNACVGRASTWWSSTGRCE
jgi:DNA-binding response OmpR family regulator